MATPERELFLPICTELLACGQAVRFRAGGTSMHPAIRDGEWVTVEPTNPAAVRRGDVVLYRSPRGLTAHRVVRVVADERVSARLVVRGDNVIASEERVDSADLLGRVTGVQRGGQLLDPGARRARLGVAARRFLNPLRRAVAALVAPRSRSLRHGLRWYRTGR